MVGLLKQKVVQSLERALNQIGVTDIEVAPLLEQPPSPDMGDFAFPCFQLARQLRQSPAAIATNLAEAMAGDPTVAKVEAVNAYVNVFLNRGETVSTVIGTILAAGDTYGEHNLGQGELVVIDYSAPNIAKPFHIGHLRSTIIGHALHHIFTKLGYETVRINHLGDWGTQFGKLIVAYRLWGDEEALAADPIKELHRLYVHFHNEAEKDPSLDDDARAAFKALEDGDEENHAIWKRFRDLSLQEFEKIYTRLGVDFDSDRGESAYISAVPQVVDALVANDLLVESENAAVVEFDDMPPCLIKKADGASLYATRDLAAAIERFETYAFRHAFYVVGMPQQLHFRQVFGVLEKMNFPWADRLEHIGFGHIRLGDAQMSTRRGHVLYLEDLLNEAVARVNTIIASRNPDLVNAEEVAETVGIGAVIFNDLFHNRTKDISFDFETALNFEGDTGPYVQYTHARAASLLRRADAVRNREETSQGTTEQRSGMAFSEEAFDDDASFHLAVALADYPATLRQAAEEREPSIIARYLVNLCQRFNSFYHARRIIGEAYEEERLAVVAATRIVIRDGLSMLGIGAPDAM